MLTEDYIVRMIRDMGQMLARVLGSQAGSRTAARKCGKPPRGTVLPCWRS